MKTKNLQIVAVASLLVLACAGQASAWSWRGRSPDKARQDYKRGDKHEWMVEQLGLTEDQQEKMREHRRAQEEQQKALREATKAKHKELAEELQKTEMNEGRIRQLADQLKDLSGQKIDARINGILTMRDILTPEQFAQFREKVKEFRGKRRDRAQDHRRPEGKRRRPGDRDRGGPPDEYGSPPSDDMPPPPPPDDMPPPDEEDM